MELGTRHEGVDAGTRGWPTRIVVAVVAALMLVTTAVTAATAQAAPSPAGKYDKVRITTAPAIPVIPENDPAFYSPPQKVVSSKAVGEIIAARRVTVATMSLLPVPVDAWQLVFRSNDTYGNPIPAVTTILKPRSNKTPDGKPRRLLVMNSATDGLARYCDPSYQYQLGSIPFQFTGSAAVGSEILQAQAGLAQGWIVSVPDVQGPKSAYAAGPLQGQIALDSARAAKRFAPLLLSSDVRVGIVGYSGGAISTNWAGELAAKYAPDLDVVGIAAGGSQPSLDQTLNMAEGQATSGLVFAAVIGLSREYPELRSYMNSHMTPEGRALLQAKNNLCLTYTSMVFPFFHNKSLLRGPDPLKAPQVARVIEKTRMGKTAPAAPVFQFHSTYDWIAPLSAVDTMVQQYCAKGANVTYFRDHASEHISASIEATPVWAMWFRDRFNGVPVKKGCTTKDVTSLSLEPNVWPEWVRIVGAVVAGAFQQPIGVR